jgi:hypothetical protein
MDSSLEYLIRYWETALVVGLLMMVVTLIRQKRSE